MLKKNTLLLMIAFSLLGMKQSIAQITNTSQSPYAKLSGVNLSDVQLTSGFWANEFNVCKDTMILNMWRLFKDPVISHAYKNFRIAAGLDTGVHVGPPFMDGDFYKWLEAVAAVYDVTKDKSLDNLMDTIIDVIGKAQRSDGYIHTPVIIAERNNKKAAGIFGDSLSFEEYNFGHLMTAACMHYRATGKKTLLDIAEKAVGFLIGYFNHISPQSARTAVCPSHYMGIIELYRTTHNPKYLALAEKIDKLRDMVKNGTDQNQDRIPFRRQTQAVGHAVRANYLYAGLADLYMETGDSTLLTPLKTIWKDVTQRKMYITGGCGALYDGVSPDGTSYHSDEIQEVHQAYGRPYQLPNFTAHDETCANIGNMMWNWRMLQITGDARYTDVMEQTLYNSILSGISLDGKSFLYSNPLSYNNELPYHLRWSEKIRDPYIGLSFCCPPNVVRTIAEIRGYMYNVSDNGLWFNLYGSSHLSTHLKDGAAIQLSEKTNYPWDGKINIVLEEMPVKEMALNLRIPGWCRDAAVRINGKQCNASITSGAYVNIKRQWKHGDIIELTLPMPVKLMASNPLVEETRNQVAVQRGPVVYCLESKDIPGNKNVLNIGIAGNTSWVPRMVTISGSRLMALEGRGILSDNKDWKNKLYQPLSDNKEQTVPIQLIPYYSWGNRNAASMEVWMPLVR